MFTRADLSLRFARLHHARASYAEGRAIRDAIGTSPAAPLALTALLLLAIGLATSGPASARPLSATEPLLYAPGTPTESPDATHAPSQPARSDTVSFGSYEIRGDGQPYALPGEAWTFDHGAADPREGWALIDLTQNTRLFWRRMTQSAWLAEGNPLPWPQMTGTGMALCGASKATADTLAWVSGIGYGNHWCQRLTSPQLAYDGTGSVPLQFRYFNQTEDGFDYTRVFVEAGPARTELNAPGFTGSIGINDLGVLTPQLYQRTVTNDELGGGVAPRTFTTTVEFQSDGGYSDEDGGGGWNSFYGPVGIDDVVLGPDNLSPPVATGFDFETDLQGWTASFCPGVGAYFTVAPRNAYQILDPCQCMLAGNVAGMQDPSGHHPVGQHQLLASPIIDRKGDLGDPTYLTYNKIFVDWDRYVVLPLQDGVLYRVTWSYYPYPNPNLPGLNQWSPRMGSPTYFIYQPGPDCQLERNLGTDAGVPVTAEQVRVYFELFASCNDFGIPPGDCTGESNETPLIDNIRVRMAAVPAAPALTYEVGCRFQDGFGQSVLGVLTSTDPGNADVTFNLRLGNPVARLGDSLVVRGSVPTASTTWESRLWFRMRRVGPRQSGVAMYNAWKSAMMAKGIDFFTGSNPGFTWGYMDSVEAGTQVRKYAFCSQFRDGPSSGGNNLPADVCFNWGGGGEQAEGNEILPDLCFVPGTQVEYFVTANYSCTPEVYYFLPDTSGGNYEEFEILPSYRTVAGNLRFPGLLYVDASGVAGNHDTLDRALNMLLLGAASGDPLPMPPRWDRYDYRDASTSWCAPLFRAVGGNNGATATQLLGYKAILVDTGTSPEGSMEPADWTGFAEWLDSPSCATNTIRQTLVVAGSQASEVVGYNSAAFLADHLGASRTCDDYATPGCPPGETENDLNDCVRLDAPPGSPLPPAIPIDLFGNWCPSQLPFAVMGTAGSGVGSRVFRNAGTDYPVSYAQVVRDAAQAPSNYRSVIANYAWRLVTARATGGSLPPNDECPSDEASRLAGLAADLSATLGWCVSPLAVSSLSVLHATPICEVGGIEEPTNAGAATTALLGTRPNPFNPRTAIRYSLASGGPTRITIYDAGGRVVRRLVDTVQAAGPHEVTWDGADDQGHRVAAGVYWSRLSAGGTESNRKLVVLR